MSKDLRKIIERFQDIIFNEILKEPGVLILAEELGVGWFKFFDTDSQGREVVSNTKDYPKEMRSETWVRWNKLGIIQIRERLCFFEKTDNPSVIIQPYILDQEQLSFMLDFDSERLTEAVNLSFNTTSDLINNAEGLVKSVKPVGELEVFLKSAKEIIVTYYALIRKIPYLMKE